MNPTRPLALLLALLLPAHLLQSAPPPSILTHQGRIAVNGTNFSGPGYFKFAFVDDGATKTYWANDGSSSGEPAVAVQVPVTSGLYSLGLGDTSHPNMVAVPASVFTDFTDVFLRTWFSTNNATFELLSPDQRVSSVGFALSAERARGVSSRAITESMLADGAVTTAKLAAGAVTLPKISPAYYTGATQSGGAGLDLSSLASGTVNFSITFDIPFATGTIPQVTLPAGWTLSGLATESGFTATAVFTPATVDATDDTGEYSSLAVVLGHPAVSYYDATNGDLKFARNSAPDGSGTWTIVTVDSAGDVGRYCSLAVVDGHPAISYFDLSNGDLKFARSRTPDGNGSWNTLTVYSTGLLGLDTSLAVVAGNPAISYYDATRDELKYTRNTEPDGSGTWNGTRVDDSGNVGRYTSLAVINGHPAISYYDIDNGDLKFARSSLETGIGFGSWTPWVVDSANTVGLHTSLAEVDGHPAISYHDATNGDLKFARATAPDGSGAWPSMAVDTTGSVGEHTSLALIDGRPAISYYDAGNGDLKFARNGAPDGSGTWTIVAVDSTDDVGEHTSLAFVAGVPAISYHDLTNADLKFARLPGVPEWTASSGDTHPLVAATAANAGKADMVNSATSAAPAWYQSVNQGGVSHSPALAEWASGSVTALVTFDRAFAGVPNVAAPGWTLQETATTGFSATRSFEPTLVDSSADVGEYASVAEVAGCPAISYYDRTSGDLKFARNSAPDGSGTWAIVAVDSAGDVGRYSSLAVIDGHPAISYYDATNGALKFARNSAADGSGTWKLVVLDSAGDVGLYTSMVYFPFRPSIAYYDATAQALKFMVNEESDGSGSWTKVTVDSAGDVGREASLAMAGGRLAIAYQDTDNDNLKFASSDNFFGTSTWTVSVVVGTGTVAGFHSLADIEGRPAICYYDQASSDLKFTRNSDFDGGGTWSTVTIDGDLIGFGSLIYNSLAMVGGYPVITYRGTGPAPLKFAHNSAPDASGTWTVTSIDPGSSPFTSLGRHNSLADVGGYPAIACQNNTFGDNELVFWSPPRLRSWHAQDPGQDSAIAAQATGVVDDSVTGAGIADDTISSADIADGSLTGWDIQDESLTSSDIADGTVTAADLASSVGVWTADGPDIFFSGGYVGIGGEPQSLLHLQPTGIGILHGLRITSSLGTNEDWYLYMDSNDSLVVSNDGAQLLTIEKDTGRVGIGTTTPSEALHVVGNAGKTEGGTSWTPLSDRRLKQDIRKFAAGLDEVMQLNPVHFRYKDNPALGLSSARENIGFLAQEVARVIPEAVSTRQPGAPDGPSYLQLHADPIHWAVVNAVQELKTEKDAEIEALEEENNRLRERLARLEASVEKLADRDLPERN